MLVGLNEVSYRGKLQILELGAGEGTHRLVELLQGRKVPFEYTSYENDTRWICTRPEVYSVVWTTMPALLRPHIYDFVIVDGPKGAVRAKWYPLLKDCVRKGSVILIDDYGHHPEFRVALNETFQYKVVGEYLPEARSGETWKVVKVEGTIR